MLNVMFCDYFNEEMFINIHGGFVWQLGMQTKDMYNAWLK
jgi:hypothetical protein